MEPKDIVQAGYNSISETYLGARLRDSEDVSLLGDFTKRLPPRATILDAGCGSGIPIARLLSPMFRVRGVDFAISQLRLARRLVPDAEFLCADMTRLPFREGAFDAICSYYAIIHVPRDEHPGLLEGFRRVLRPGGLLLACMGADDVREDFQEDYYGAPMYWSHFDAETNLGIVRNAGFQTLHSKIVPDDTSPGSRHLFVLAKRKLTPSVAKSPTTSPRSRRPGPAASRGRS